MLTQKQILKSNRAVKRTVWQHTVQLHINSHAKSTTARLEKQLFLYMQEINSCKWRPLNHMMYYHLTIRLCTHNVSHNAQLMKRGLSVEQDNITIYKMPFHNITKFQLLCHLFSVSIFQESYNNVSLKKKRQRLRELRINSVFTMQASPLNVEVFVLQWLDDKM